jgi:hypothetical protein
MAISNLPYDDHAIVDAVRALPVQSETVSQVSVNFLSNEIDEGATATVTATMTWVVSSVDAVAILDAARPRPVGPAEPVDPSGESSPICTTTGRSCKADPQPWDDGSASSTPGTPTGDPGRRFWDVASTRGHRHREDTPWDT